MSTQEIYPVFNQQDNETANLNKWMFEIIQPYIKGRILETNSGLDSISSTLVEQNIALHLSNPNRGDRDALSDKFNGTPLIKGIHNMDLRHPNFEQYYSTFLGNFSTVLVLNAIESDFYEKTSLQNAKAILRRNGHLIIAAPSFTALYTGLELSPDEWRKFNRKPLKQLLSGCQILKTNYFNIEDCQRADSSYQFGFSALVIASKI